MSEDSAEIYNALAPHYREYSRKKSAYISGVDRFILDHTPVGAQSLLDVGSGDGIRGMSLAKQMNIGTIVLSDVSENMIAKCRELNPSDVWQVPAQNLPDTGQRFDVITCLWNVLGHLPGRDARIRALKRMAGLLSNKGLIFFDVNNRHNGSAYGFFRVFARIVTDFLKPDERRGDASFNWPIGDLLFPAMGHLFTPAEIQGIIASSGLNIKNRVSVNYATGTHSLSPYQGQLVYIVTK